MPKKISTTRSDLPLKTSSAKASGQQLDTFPDRIDLRDWYDQPSLISLPDAYLACPLIPRTRILDQGQEGRVPASHWPRW